MANFPNLLSAFNNIVSARRNAVSSNRGSPTGGILGPPPPPWQSFDNFGFTGGGGGNPAFIGNDPVPGPGGNPTSPAGTGRPPGGAMGGLPIRAGFGSPPAGGNNYGGYGSPAALYAAVSAGRMPWQQRNAAMSPAQWAQANPQLMSLSRAQYPGGPPTPQGGNWMQHAAQYGYQPQWLQNDYNMATGAGFQDPGSYYGAQTQPPFWSDPNAVTTRALNDAYIAMMHAKGLI